MKYSYLIILLLIVAFYARVDISAQLPEDRNEGGASLRLNFNDHKSLLNAFLPLKEDMMDLIVSAIQDNDDEMNHQLIAFLTLRALPFVGDIDFERPVDVYEQIRNIHGLKWFLLDQLNKQTPDFGIFTTLVVFFKDDPHVIARLITKSHEHDVYLYAVVHAFGMAGVYLEDINPLVAKLIQNDNIAMAMPAVQYLEHVSLDAALPALIKLYAKSNDEVRESALPEYFDRYVYRDNSFLTTIKQANAPQVTADDVKRMLIGRALLSYPREELADHADDILRLEKHIQFGPLGRSSYDQLKECLTPMPHRP